MRRLRVHHLLCIPLFKGEGYSDDFSRNMSAVIKQLEDCADQPLQAVCGPDMICAGCPNLMRDGRCADSAPVNPEAEQGEERALLCGVDKKDRELARKMGIVPGQIYTYRELLEGAQHNLTKEIFDGSCRNCRWYRKGLCSFEKWEEARMP